MGKFKANNSRKRGAPAEATGGQAPKSHASIKVTALRLGFETIASLMLLDNADGKHSPRLCSHKLTFYYVSRWKQAKEEHKKHSLALQHLPYGGAVPLSSMLL